MSSVHSSQSTEKSATRRAEAPPAHFWRRWVGDDAPAASALAAEPAVEPPAIAAEPETASPPHVQAQTVNVGSPNVVNASPPRGDSLLNARVIDAPRNYGGTLDIDAAIVLPDFSMALPAVDLPTVPAPTARNEPPPPPSAYIETPAFGADGHHEVEEIALPDATDGFVAGPASKADKIGMAEFARLQAEFRATLEPTEEPPTPETTATPPPVPVAEKVQLPVKAAAPKPEPPPVPVTAKIVPPSFEVPAYQPPADVETLGIELPDFMPSDFQPLHPVGPTAVATLAAASGNSRSGYINPNPPVTDADLLFDPAEQARIDAMLKAAAPEPPQANASGIQVEAINVGRAVDAPQTPAVGRRSDSLLTAKVLDAKPEPDAPVAAQPPAKAPASDARLPEARPRNEAAAISDAAVPTRLRPEDFDKPAPARTETTKAARADVAATAPPRPDSAIAPKVHDKLAANAQKAAETAKSAPPPAKKPAARKTPKAIKAVALAFKPAAAKPKPSAAARAAVEEANTAPADAVAPAADAPFRILIVEDDRGQALFAQSILHGAGMQADVEMEADKVLAAIARFQPDLVLMDLHMPGRDGMSLTQDIRATPVLANLPVVFLTGDPDPEKQYEVLESGADDYLTKPIRPRHLILSVSNRIRRARQNNQPTPAAPTINPETGLPTRTHVMQQLAAAVKSQTQAGLFFIEIEAAVELREKYDYGNFEHLMLQVGRCLAQAASPHPVTRLGDDSFLALGNGLSGDALHAFARSLRVALGHASFTLRNNNARQPLQGVVGYAELPQQNFVDAGSALEATERAALDARAQASGVSAHVADAPQDEFTRLLSNAELELAFQPIVATAGNDEAQYQVLLRMRRADGSLMSAAQAVPAAEQSGRIVELDRQVMESVLATLAQSQAEGSPLRLFVSQSPRSLARDDAAEWLFGALIRFRADPRQLVVDLRLADALTNSVTLGQFCQRLMSVGVQFSLSQYEPIEGAAALLTQLPLSYLRLSPRYREVHKQPRMAEELRGIVERAHQLGLQVVGQQIEEEQAMNAMWMGGVDFIQGNLVQGVGSDMGFDFHNAVL